MTHPTTHSAPAAVVAPARARAELLEKVEDRLHALLNDEYRRRTSDLRAAVLIESLAELVSAGDGRVRPQVLLTGYLAAGGSLEGPEAEAAVDAAAALELLDTCTLVRADVYDNAPLRRGLPALHVRHAGDHERNGWAGESRRFGECAATLGGDLALAWADRLVRRLPPEAVRLWEELRTERALGLYTHEATAAAYLEDPWPGQCIAGCTDGCAAGWYALRHPLLLGAHLAGRPDLAGTYADYALPLHAAWRMRGFLSGGPEYDWEAELLREVLLEDRERAVAEEIIRDLTDRAGRVAAGSALSPEWREELAAFAGRVTAG
ncbi:polyprenyl synthetase family protein [Streptomyces sp. NPDC046876]|uniref:polyprenyl synthetase family protein n=1 Tax=Streptomyces sp. NPDC046876 TaxID=3155616 RepID=UPI0033F4608C